MPLIEKKIWNELLDADSSPHLVSASAFINAMNIRYGTADDGYVGMFQNIKGNSIVPYLFPAGDNICIGACSDDTDTYPIFFNWNSAGDDAIFLYDLPNGVMYLVISDVDVTGGLNFDKYKLINGAYVINGVLYFNDAYNEPRKVNLGSFIDAQGSGTPIPADYSITYPIEDHELTVIKTPCPIPPYIQKNYNSSFSNNFIKNDSFQFAIEYGYYDGEKSVLSEWSKATLLNLASENYNYVTVSFPLVPVPQTVRLIRLVVKDALTSKAWVIKTWDREDADDNTAINGNTLSYDFYNNVSGEFISDATKVRPFHSVPELAGTIAVAQNRLTMADITKGKDTPIPCSLTAAATSFTVSLSNITVPLLKIGHRRRGISGDSAINGYAFIAYFVYIPGGNGVIEGYYMVNGTDLSTITASALPAFPTLGSTPTSPQAFSAFTFKGLTLQNVYANTLPAGAGIWSGAPTLTFIQTVSGSSMQITGLSTSSYRVFKSNSQYNLGKVFYDRYRRRCGVVFNDTEVVIPERNYAHSTGYGNIIWELSNGDALNEIPDWAYSYAIVMTRNLRTRNFISAYAGSTCKYATRDTNGLMVYTRTTFDNSVVAIAIDSKGLLQANLGYEFNENDQCVLIDNSDTKNELPVIGQDGNYILIAPKDIGTLTTKTFVYEIYTPYKPSEEEPFFAVGEVHFINEPGTISREYDVLTGSIRADACVLSRNFNSTSYFAQAMSPNDVYWQRWFTDAGQPNFITKQGRVRKKTGFCFSDVLIPGTQTNGLSAFDALNEQILPESLGAIRKLQLTSKLQQEGNVMLAIGENNTASIYLGEAQLFDAKQSSFLAKTDGFIGQVNELAGGFGTQNPESVVMHKGQVFWADLKNYSIVRYGGNGIYPISNNGIARSFRLFCRKYLTLSVGEIEALGSRPFLFGGVDRYHNEYFLTIPRVEEEPPKGNLDYTPAGATPLTVYGMQHVSNVSPALTTGSRVYQSYVSYYVIIVNGVVPGYYVVSNTETVSGLLGSAPTLPSLPAAPAGTITMSDLHYVGANETEFYNYIYSLATSISGGVASTRLTTITNTGGTISLDDTDSVVYYPYDFYDGQGKVLVYKILADKWAAPHGYEPEMFCHVGSRLFTFKDGSIWENNVNPYFNSFFGVRSKSRIMFVERGPDEAIRDKVKKYVSMIVGCNIAPTFVHFRTEDPNVQSSDLVSSDFELEEGIFYASIMKDRLSPNTTGDPFIKQKFGDKMRGPWMFILMEWDTLSLLQLKYVNVGCSVSAGHEFV